MLRMASTTVSEVGDWPPPGVDPASKVRGAVSLIFGRQVS